MSRILCPVCRAKSRTYYGKITKHLMGDRICPGVSLPVDFNGNPEVQVSHTRVGDQPQASIEWYIISLQRSVREDGVPSVASSIGTIQQNVRNWIAGKCLPQDLNLTRLVRYIHGRFGTPNASELKPTNAPKAPKLKQMTKAPKAISANSSSEPKPTNAPTPKPTTPQDTKEILFVIRSLLAGETSPKVKAALLLLNTL